MLWCASLVNYEKFWSDDNEQWDDRLSCHVNVPNEAFQGDLGWSSFEAREATSKISYDARLRHMDRVVIGVGLMTLSVLLSHSRIRSGGGGRRVRIQWVVFFGSRSRTGKVGQDASLGTCMGENVLDRENAQERRGDDRVVDDGTVESDRIVLVTGEGEASQTLGRYHLPWAVVKKEGTAQSAHCTCMAGLGEACSHVAALLFLIEADIKFGVTSPSSTSAECLWIAASSTAQKVAPTTLVIRNLIDSEDTDTASSINAGDDHALEVFGTLVDMACFYGSLDETAAREATLTAVECSQVALSTRAQAGSDEWFRQRKGRITASIINKVISCCTGVAGVVSQVMSYTEAPNVSSVRWGRDNENDRSDSALPQQADSRKGEESHIEQREARPSPAESP
ncbi:hypothetical protein HPB47_002265 [Ixodes persulcatus]|uniref:Uncharacterized protein n=1 Tax=Ixodes persulcatus TaxID=34615 RepID=A0AC60PLU4_IXOPE|nr:hypothetical protein HPB47_002265 [Ixodes persulcatus]